MLTIDEQYDDACYAYAIGEYEDAVHRFQSLVERRHALAATYLASMYARGEGVSKDAARAIELYERAINWGDPLAAYNLAASYHSGNHGIPQDRQKSKRYFLKAKEMGCEMSVDDKL